MQEFSSNGIVFTDKNSVTIFLDELDNGDIPEKFWDVDNITELKIVKTRPQSSWVTLPPLSWFEERKLDPPYWKLPKEISKLQSLKSLYLINIDLPSLPNSISKLKELETLDLSMNKLELSRELVKLKELDQLEKLILLGNHYEESVMNEFVQEHSHTDIKYRQEEN